MVGGRPPPTFGCDRITKAAVINMTKAFARECGEYNIRVNALLPGLTKTRFAGALFDNAEMHREIIGRIPLGRVEMKWNIRCLRRVPQQLEAV